MSVGDRQGGGKWFVGLAEQIFVSGMVDGGDGGFEVDPELVGDLLVGEFLGIEAMEEGTQIAAGVFGADFIEAVKPTAEGAVADLQALFKVAAGEADAVS